jgi:hypothetical protein
MQAIPPVAILGDLEVGTMLGHVGLPLGQFRIAALEA